MTRRWDRRNEMTNRQYAETDKFKATCKRAAVKATPRQASKYRNRKGRAYRHGRVVGALAPGGG